MLESTGATRFTLREAGPDAWVVCDRSVPTDDPRHIVASVSEAGSDRVDVVWTPATGLPAHFISPDAALDAFRRWAAAAG
ncbi:hypothetical protein [Microbacterium sp. HJ5]